MNRSTQFQIELFDLLFKLDITIDARVKVFQRLNRFKSELLSIQKNTKAFKIALSQEIIPNIQIQVLVYKWVLSELMKDSDSFVILSERLIKLESKKTHNVVSYKLKEPSTLDIEQLYFNLLDYELIGLNTTIEQFSVLFSGAVLGNIQPVVWSSNNASELLYFVNLVEKHTEVIWSRYQRIEYCFVRSDGRPFNVNWKQLNNMLEVNLALNKQQKINSIFAGLSNLIQNY